MVQTARWEVLDGARQLGRLLQLEIRDPAGAVRFYQIQDRAGRLVGSATAAGRFSRRVPFRDEEEDLGVWRLERGVAELFGLPQPVQLRPVPLEVSKPPR